MPKYEYIKIIHTGLDYTRVKYGNKFRAVDGIAPDIIKALLKKIEKDRKRLEERSNYITEKNVGDTAECLLDKVEDQMDYYAGNSRAMAKATLIAELLAEDVDDLELEKWFSQDDIKEIAYEFSLDNYCSNCGKREDEDGRCGCTHAGDDLDEDGEE